MLIDLLKQEYRNLLICNNCLWAASLLKDSASVRFQLCPMCGRKGLDFKTVRIVAPSCHVFGHAAVL